MDTLNQQQQQQQQQHIGFNQKENNWDSWCVSSSSPPPPPPPEKKAKYAHDDDDDDYDDEILEYDSDGCHEMTKKERRQYYQDLNISDGFDMRDFSKVMDFGIIIPVYLSENKILQLITHSETAIKVFNTQTGENWKFVRLLKANSQIVSGVRYYITFVAEDNDDKGHTKIFQASVIRGIEQVKVEFCRTKPTV